MLRTRIITAVISLLVLGVVLFVLPPDAVQIVIGLLILAGAWEWSGFLELKSTSFRLLYVVLVSALLALLVFALSNETALILQIACVWWFIAFVWTFFFPTPIPIAVRWICGLLVLIPLFVALLVLYRLDAQLLLFALLIVWAADMGAYFAGKQFGRVKLAPSISPGKTWEGVFGGLLLVAVLSVAWGRINDLPLAVLVPFCLAVAALSVVGDLTVSMFKRTAGVKDSGKLFPGHGGVLDRVDSVAAASPLFALGVNWLGLV
ncbi:MAG TPA: phosphatidate cytidylyltransferase [Woeseiaceae bacterium]|nr:phosphatidate cytidylyltransferase [Woeseiaceae bacterium]